MKTHAKIRPQNHEQQRLDAKKLIDSSIERQTTNPVGNLPIRRRMRSQYERPQRIKQGLAANPYKLEQP
jgi:hypothetical protein